MSIPILSIDEAVDHKRTPRAHDDASGIVHRVATHFSQGPRVGRPKHHDPRDPAARRSGEVVPVRDRVIGKNDQVTRHGECDVAGGTSYVDAPEKPE